VTGTQHAYREDAGYYEERAAGLLASATDGTESAVAAFARHGAPLTLEGARAAVAGEHGLPNWEALLAHIGALDAEPFARAYRAVEARDRDALRALLDEFPDLVTAQGTNGNDLLGMAGATGHLPLSVLLIERGADPARGNAHGWTALHQAAYGNQTELAQRLLDAGARVDLSARGAGGTPLIVALFWGHRAVAELLAEQGVHPRNLRAAAGLGRVDLIEELLEGGEAGAQRGFYRPHSGFPAWRPSDDPQEVLDEALAWAARNDRADALEALVARGARVDADVYRGTALTWAAACGRVDAIRRLVALGADPNARTTFGGPDHGVDATALHLAAGAGKLAAIEVLLELGADPALEDALYHSTPAGWAEHGGEPAAAQLLHGWP
jgi:ankyrin repeat protein